MVCFLCMPTAAPVQSGGMTVQIYHFLCSGTAWAKCQNVKSGCPRIRYFRPGEGGGENNGFSCGGFLSFCNERRSCTVLLSVVPEVCAYGFTVGKAASLFRCHSVFGGVSVSIRGGKTVYGLFLFPFPTTYEVVGLGLAFIVRTTENRFQSNEFPFG